MRRAVAAANPYVGYYLRQTGGGLPYYSGRARQRGHGVGGVLKGLLRSVAPVILPKMAALGTKALKKVGSTALAQGVGLVQDVLGGTSFKRAATHRLRRTGKAALHTLANTALGAIKNGAGSAPRRSSKGGRRNGRARQSKAAQSRKRRGRAPSRGPRRKIARDIFG